MGEKWCFGWAADFGVRGWFGSLGASVPDLEALVPAARLGFGKALVVDPLGEAIAVGGKKVFEVFARPLDNEPDGAIGLVADPPGDGGVVACDALGRGPEPHALHTATENDFETGGHGADSIGGPPEGCSGCGGEETAAAEGESAPIVRAAFDVSV